MHDGIACVVDVLAAAPDERKQPIPDDAPRYTAEPPPAYTIDHKY